MITICLGCLMACINAHADTPLAFYKSFAGNVNFVGTQQTIRNKSTASDPCSVLPDTRNLSAQLSGIPSNGTVLAAYLYWAGSGSPDYTVTFEGVARSATRQWVSSSTGLDYFAAAVDVTTDVIVKRNGNYTVTDLTVDSGLAHCGVQRVMGGWSLLVIYSSISQPFRVLNVYEGLQPIQNGSVTLNVGNFEIPTPIGSATGRVAHLTWEGDEELSGPAESLSFNGTELTDVENPAGNQFNSNSTLNGDNRSYGIDFDGYTVGAPTIQAGQTSATTVYSSGDDMVLLNVEVVAVPNVPVADLALTNVSVSTFARGTDVSYTLSVKNNGPNAEPGPITVTDTLPASLTLVSAAGTGWSCTATGQTVTCSNSSPLANGATASTLTLTATLSPTATGTISNTATVSGIGFDNTSANNTAVASNAVLATDLALTMARSATLIPGQSVSYTLSLSNGGQASEPGPVTLTDTLPAGLGFMSASGSGWSCSASGQLVSCSYASPLDSLASASPLVLTAMVAGDASGPYVNSATVTGTGYETNLANNTASDAYTIAVGGQRAWYKMDELAWNGAAGEVKDASGNARHGVRVGAANTALSTNPVAGCRVARIPFNTDLASQSAVSVPVKPSDMGLAGTIAFWYKSNANWNDGTERMLFDATGAVSTYPFHLMRTGTGALQFSMTDSASAIPTAVSGAFTHAAGSWHHIAVTWSIAAGSGQSAMQVYVDGVQSVPPAGVSQTSSGSWPSGGNAYLNLYFGDNRSSSSVPSQGSDNSADGDLDEIYIYAGVLSASEIGQLMQTSHTCGALHHYQMSMPSNSISCMPTSVTVTACADSSSPCTNPFPAAMGTQATLSIPSGGAVLAASTVTFDGDGVASTTVSYPNAGGGSTVTVNLSGEQTLAANPRVCCPDGASCVVSNSCSSTFQKSGLIFTTSAGGLAAPILDHVAGVASPTYVLRALKSGGNSCAAALAGAQSVELAYQCNNPDTCSSGSLMNIVSGATSTPIAPNDAAAVGSYSAVTLNFDANGNAPFVFNYRDAGKVTLHARDTINNATLTGASNAFVVKPYGFELSAIAYGATANPQAASASGPLFAPAGSPFGMSVRATTAAGATTPNYGREMVSAGVEKESVRLSVSADTATFPEMVNLPELMGSFGSFSGGVASGSNFSWGDVGIINLTPSVADGDYLGAGDVTGAMSPNVGRFVPHHFRADSAQIVNRSALAACSSSFTYMGEPFRASFMLNAFNAASDVTQNYQGNFAKLSATDWLAAGAGGSIGLRMLGTIAAGASLCKAAFDPLAPFHTRFACSGAARADIARTAGARVAVAGTPAAPAWLGGATPMQATLVLERADGADGPYGGIPGEVDAVSSLALGIAPQDSDGVTGSGFDLDADLDTVADHLAVGSTALRYGRLAIANAYGSELLNLPVALRAQYWADGRFAASSDDNCSPLDPVHFMLAPGKGAAIATTVMGGASMSSGRSAGTFRLSKPSNAPVRKGSVVLSTFPGAPDALDKYLPGTGTMTFGVYKAGPVIFIREMY